MRTVSTILAETHGLVAAPGSKVNCPFCNHKTFSIKRDDTLGKCFHPSCERFITPHRNDAHSANRLYAVLEEICHDCHQALLAQEDAEGRTAYTYLVQERSIHPQVIDDAPLGVLPSSYDLVGKFQSAIDELQLLIDAEQATQKGKRGRPKKSASIAPEQQLHFLTEAQDKLAQCCRGHAGWLMFFYTDAHHRIVAIRFREPYSKRIVYFKPFRTVAGVFGHGMFAPYQSDALRVMNAFLLVTEGECNALQLQSLCLRYGEASGQTPGYVHACAVGGVTNADYATIKKIACHPIMCYDHDVSGAGFALVEKARQTMRVSAFTTPQPDSDLDAFIRSFGDNHQGAWEAVKALIDSRTLYYRDYAGVAEEIFQARQKQGSKDIRREFEINAAVAAIMLTDLQERGTFYHDIRDTYFFVDEDRQLLIIEPDDPLCTRFLARYGINRAEPIFRYLLEAWRIEAFTRGTESTIYRLAFYNPESFTVYVCNHKAQIYRISPDTIDLVANGTDGILFLAQANAEPFELLEPNPSESLFDRLILGTIPFAETHLTPAEGRLVVMLWFLALFFESLMPTKPILAFIGPKGAAKTTTTRKIGRLLFGPSFDVTPLTDDVRDFDAAVTNSAFVALDNSDQKSKWLNDRLAVVATGGTIRRRVYYTTNQLAEYPARCFLAITSRTPHFRRDDVADRLLLMRVQRFESFVAESAISAEVSAHRNALMTEVVYHLQDVVRALQARQDATYSGTFRMADFAAFAVTIGRFAGIGDEIEAILAKLSHEQAAFTVEYEPNCGVVAAMGCETSRARDYQYGTVPGTRAACRGM